MRSFTFHPGPRLIAGDGEAAAIAGQAAARPMPVRHRPKSLVAFGLTDACREALEASGRETILFDPVEADPSRDTLLAAREAGRAAGVTSVVGFGGGSPMDVAKLAAYLLGSGDELDEIWGVEIATGQRLPLILVPTTAGTGSEATPISVITCEGGVKLAVNARPLTADWAVLDPGLTVGLPRHVTAATGIDAIVHAVEAYHFGAAQESDVRRACPRGAAPAQRAICSPPATSRAIIEARSAMLLGAHLAGLAFSNAPVAGVHALAYPLGGIHHLPHGVSNALMLRPVLGIISKRRASFMPSCAEIVDPGCAGAGQPGAAPRC